MANEKRLIDANALISYFSGGEAMKTMTQSIYEAMFVKALQDAPTVDAVEVVHGRWITWQELFPKKFSLLLLWKKKGFCSNCGAFRYKDNYCPNCGAKMDGDGNG